MALASPRRAVPSAVAPANATALLRRVTGTWSEPEPWTVAVLLVTGVVILARHPIAHAIGTEATESPVAAPFVATAPPAAATTLPAPAAGAAVAAVPTHAPRDPFAALVDASGKVLAPEAATAATVAPRHHTAVHPGQVTGAACTGAAYRVASGDTLWTITARAIGSTDDKRVTVAWHRVYAANRAAIGSDPALLPVGAKLCLPSSR